jgi:diadenylate cyclase
MLEKLGGRSFKEFLTMREEERDIDRVISQTVHACEKLSKERTGALIVFENKDPLIDHVKNGTTIDARVSSELLRNIFFTKAALHDGAVIVRNDRIAAAGCVLPVSNSTALSKDLGTRHRAGVGISEVSDTLTVIVSEETGTISVAVGGMLKRHLAPQMLERLLRTELMPDEADQPENLAVKLRQKLLKNGKGESKR